MSIDPFAPITGGGKPSKGKKAPPARTAVVPVPAGAPAPPAQHPELGKPSLSWRYLDAAGGTLGFVHRFDTPKGKEFRPLVLFQVAGRAAPTWWWQSWPEPRPLYGLDRLAGRPDATVIVTEGEKACDAAGKLCPSCVTVASPNGAKSAAKADWSVLKGRAVIIWPDADTEGFAYAEDVAKLAAAAGAGRVAIVAPPAEASVGWDAADALEGKWTAQQVSELLATARPMGSSQSSAGKTRRPPQRDALMGLTELCSLWHGLDGETFVTFQVNGHRESWPVRSPVFKRWLANRAYVEVGVVPGSQAVEDTLRVLEARAANEGPERLPWMRTGSRDGRIFIDLCDATWRCVEIGPYGWTVLDRHDLPFIRSPAMRPMAEPEAGEGIGTLRSFINAATEEDFILTVAWLIAALRDSGPYPILVINGEHGSGKSMFARLIRRLVDPNAAPIRAAPRDDRDLIVAAINSHMICLDNLSKLDAWLADALCRLATGGGFSTRALHTDRDEIVFQATKPIVLNGIPHLTDRADLADRAVTVRLRVIPDEERRPEDEFLRDWDVAEPRVLGALFDAISMALRRIGDIRLPRAGRMADFEKWIAAAELSLGWADGTFQAAYRDNRRDASDSTYEADSVAVAIGDLMKDRSDAWSGTATELLTALSERVSEAIKRSRLWPMSPQGIGNRIDRIAPLLRGRGLQIERKHSGVRTITIAWLQDRTPPGQGSDPF